jgi:hypothetical protein
VSKLQDRQQLSHAAVLKKVSDAKGRLRPTRAAFAAAEGTMRLCIISPRNSLRSVRIVLIAAMTVMLSGWTTCSAIFAFNNCQTSIPQPHISTLSPSTIPGEATPVLLVVSGSDFVSQSQIMWNGSPLQTTFLNSNQLQTAISPQTVQAFSGSGGSAIQVSVRTLGSAAVLGCPNGGNSATLFLVIL